MHVDRFPEPFESWLPASTHPGLSLSSSIDLATVCGVRRRSYIQVYVLEPGTSTNQPYIYAAARFRLQKHGEHSLL